MVDTINVIKMDGNCVLRLVSFDRLEKDSADKAEALFREWIRQKYNEWGYSEDEKRVLEEEIDVAVEDGIYAFPYDKTTFSIVHSTEGE